MTVATVLLRLALVLTPARGRDRAAEEWRADVAGRAEFGLSASSIASGALHIAASARLALAARAVGGAVAACSPGLIGLAIGAVCAMGDVSVLVVFVSAGLIRGAVFAIAHRRARATRRSRHASAAR